MKWLTDLWENCKTAFNDFLSASGISVLLAVLTALLGIILIKVMTKAVNSGLRRSGKATALAVFLVSILKAALYILLFIIVISILGIPVTSFLVVLGSASIAVGLAMQGTLSNFISGIMLIVNKPFRLGDFVDLNDKTGTVRSIGILNTSLITPDNKLIILANSEVIQHVMTNYNFHSTRRVEWKISVAYGSDTERVKEVILGVLNAHPEVLRADYKNPQKPPEESLSDPDTKTNRKKKRKSARELLRLNFSDNYDPKTAADPMVRLSAMGVSSLDFVARAWTRTEKYWDVFFDINELVLDALIKNDISVPFPQMDVHLKKD